MIEAFIGLAFGAGGMWLWRFQAFEQAKRDYQRQSASLKSESASADKWAREYRDMKAKWEAAVDKNVEHIAAHSRCSDSQSVLHDKIQSLRSLCSNRKDSTAIAAMKIIGDGQ